MQRPKDRAWWREGKDSSVVGGVKEAMGRPGTVELSVCERKSLEDFEQEC